MEKGRGKKNNDIKCIYEKENSKKSDERQTIQTALKRPVNG
jgi:hypothetical protein